MKMNFRKLSSLFLVAPVFADELNITLTPPTGSQFFTLTNLGIPGIVSGLITLVLVAAALIFFFILVLGGIRWITSQGDEGKVKEARAQVTQALIGLAVVFAAWAIVRLVQVLFNINILNLTIPSFTGTTAPAATPTP